MVLMVEGTTSSSPSAAARELGLAGSGGLHVNTNRLRIGKVGFLKQGRREEHVWILKAGAGYTWYEVS